MDRMAELLASIRACPRQPGVDEDKIPGQPEHETCERRLAEGLELPEAVEQELRQLAAHYQVEYMTESPRAAARRAARPTGPAAPK